VETEMNANKNQWGNCSVSPQKEQLIETAVFLALIAPTSIISFFVMREETVGFVITAVSTIFRDIALIALILFFLWHNGETLAAIGWKVRDRNQEIILGLLLFVPFTATLGFVEKMLLFMGFSISKEPLPSFLHAQGTVEYILAFILVAIVAVAEETIFRGYLILRFRALTTSPLAAVLLSGIIFSLGHGYEGTAGVITVGLMGVFFALVYLWRQSLVAPMIIHFLQDFIGIVLVPLTGGR
jgi:uncharacterized protein